MKTARKFVFSLFLVVVWTSIHSQTYSQTLPANTPDIWTSEVNKGHFLDFLRSENAARELVRQSRSAGKEGVDLNSRYAFRAPDGSYQELASVSGDVHVYRKTHNYAAATMIGTSRVRDDYGLTGAGIRIGLWDAGYFFPHSEFSGRITIGESTPASAYSTHATHVAGTMIATGLDHEATGMAPEATVVNYNWDRGYLEMYEEANSGLRISNHSYDFSAGWDPVYSGASGSQEWSWNYYSKPFELSAYSKWSYYWDWDMDANPYYLIVKAAGNEAGQGPETQGIEHYHDGMFSTRYSDDHDLDCESGYGCLGPAATLKNGLVFGALKSDGRTLTSFSSRGPTLDGRIKPDLVSMGENVYSTLSSDGYGVSSGTSMATPTVTGSIALLLDLEKRLYGDTPYFLASTLKAIMIHTADDLGNPGPDYEYGWGRANVAGAVDLIRRDHSENRQFIMQPVVSETMEYTLNSDGGDFRATLVWTDPTGNHPNAIHDKSNPILVQDYNLVVEQNGRLYYPFYLDAGNPSAIASTGRNTIDNVEQIHLTNLLPGPVTIKIITPTGEFKKISVSLIVTTEVAALATPIEVAPDKFNMTEFSVFSNPVVRGSQVSIETRFELGQEVLVNVFDATGRQMETLYEGFSTGLNMSAVIPSNWAPGVYFIRIHGSEINQTKKLIVL